MQAGRLRHRVTLQTPTETVDATGARTHTWSTYATVWASIELLSGREFFSAQQVQSDVNARIRVRYDASIHPKMRVLHVADSASSLTGIYDIQSVIPVRENRRELHLMCVRRDAEGFRNG